MERPDGRAIKGSRILSRHVTPLMPNYPLLQVDAFTNRPLAGNPCAVVLDAHTMETETMQAVATEMNLAETAFVVQTDAADVGARYFTPFEEIPFAGHPTVSTMAALIDAGRLSNVPQQTVTLQTPSGIIPVEIISGEDGIVTVTMTQLAPVFGRTYTPESLAPVFGLSPDDFFAETPPQTVSTGTPMLMAPIRSHEALRRAALDFDAYRAAYAAGDFFSPHLFCLGGATEAGDTFARQFGIPPDLLEDPFTGSATGAMACYLWHYGLLETPTFIAEQGHWMGRPGQATVEVLGSRKAIEGVRVGGQAVVVLRGTLSL